jgi:DNA-binding PucR family transcriptional regulator
LNEVLNNPQIIRIYEDTIKKLKDYDVNNGTELIGTLSCYIENNYNVLKTAEYLYIHRNTLYKRLKKIESIMELDIKNAHKNLIIGLGLKLHKLYSNTEI